jgi:hypothetical protein
MSLVSQASAPIGARTCWLAGSHHSKSSLTLALATEMRPA